MGLSLYNKIIIKYTSVKSLKYTQLHTRRGELNFLRLMLSFCQFKRKVFFKFNSLSHFRNFLKKFFLFYENLYLKKRALLRISRLVRMSFVFKSGVVSLKTFSISFFKYLKFLEYFLYFLRRDVLRILLGKYFKSLYVKNTNKACFMKMKNLVYIYIYIFISKQVFWVFVKTITGRILSRSTARVFPQRVYNYFLFFSKQLHNENVFSIKTVCCKVKKMLMPIVFFKNNIVFLYLWFFFFSNFYNLLIWSYGVTISSGMFCSVFFKFFENCELLNFSCLYLVQKFCGKFVSHFSALFFFFSTFALNSLQCIKSQIFYEFSNFVKYFLFFCYMQSTSLDINLNFLYHNMGSRIFFNNNFLFCDKTIRFRGKMLNYIKNLKQRNVVKLFSRKCRKMNKPMFFIKDKSLYILYLYEKIIRYLQQRCVRSWKSGIFLNIEKFYEYCNDLQSFFGKLKKGNFCTVSNISTGLTGGELFILFPKNININLKILQFFIKNFDDFSVCKNVGGVMPGRLQDIWPIFFVLKIKVLQSQFLALSIMRLVIEKLIAFELSMGKTISGKIHRAIYNSYYRLYKVIYFTHQEIFKKFRVKSTGVKYGVQVFDHDSFFFYAAESYAFLPDLWFFDKNNSISWRNVGFFSFFFQFATSALQLFEMQRNGVLTDNVKYRFFKSFKHNTLEGSVTECIPFLVGASNQLNFEFLKEVYKYQMWFFKLLRYQLFINFLGNLYNFDFFFFKFYKYIICLYRKSFIMQMKKDFVLSKKFPANIHILFLKFLKSYERTKFLSRFWYESRMLILEVFFLKRHKRVLELKFRLFDFNFNDYCFFTTARKKFRTKLRVTRDSKKKVFSYLKQ